MKKLKAWIACTLALGLGVLIGFILFGSRPLGDAADRREPESERQKHSQLRTNEIRFEPEEENEMAIGHYVSGAETDLPAADEPIEIDRELATRMSLSILNPSSLELNATIVKHFKLTEDQATEINLRTDQLYSELRIMEAQLAHKIVTEKGDEKLRIEPHAEAAGAVESFISTVIEVAGKKKGEQIAKLIATSSVVGALGEYPEEVAIMERSRPDGTSDFFLERMILDPEGAPMAFISTNLDSSPKVRNAYETVFPVEEESNRTD